jgi:hypothetical protein
LEARIAQLTRHRPRIARLADGERLFLPADMIAVLAELCVLGVSERGVQIERDAWLLMAAMGPDLVSSWAAEKRAALKDPEFVYLACNEISDFDPDDPRLGELADVAVAWSSRRSPEAPGGAGPTGAALAAATLVERARRPRLPDHAAALRAGLTAGRQHSDLARRPKLRRTAAMTVSPIQRSPADCGSTSRQRLRTPRAYRVRCTQSVGGHLAKPIPPER